MGLGLSQYLKKNNFTFHFDRLFSFTISVATTKLILAIKLVGAINLPAIKLIPAINLPVINLSAIKLISAINLFATKLIEYVS